MIFCLGCRYLQSRSALILGLKCLLLRALYFLRFLPLIQPRRRFSLPYGRGEDSQHCF